MSKQRALWHHHLRTPFLVNVAVGILIAFLFALTAGSQWGEEVRNTAFDLLTRWEYRYGGDSPQGTGNPLFFVEITPQEYRQLGEPLLTPRDKVAELIETAWTKGAPVVVLDILLDRPDLGNPAGDLKLHRLLERMLRENARTRVVFPVRIGSDGVLRSHLADDLFERATADGRRIFYRATPTVVASQVDLLNRFWAAYQPCLDRHGKSAIVWSVPLLASALYSGSDEQLEGMEKRLLPAGAHHPAEGHGHGAELPLELGKSELHLAPPVPVATQAGENPVLESGDSHALPYAQRIRFLISPQTLARRDAGNFRPGLSPDSLSGKIVVIGNSSPETGDILPTPVGQMPGMYLMGNAINTIATDRMPAHMNQWLDYLVEAFVIVIAAWLFLYLHTLLAVFLSVVLFLAIFLPASGVLYHYWGVFFNFFIPVVGMRLHGIADGIEALIESKGRKHHHHPPPTDSGEGPAQGAPQAQEPGPADTH